MQILSEGQTIRHEQYGIGVVTESNTDRTTINFDDHGLKKFVTSIWNAQLVGEAPAVRVVRRRSRRKPFNDLTGIFCTSGSEREFTLEGSWYANEEIQAGADCDVVTAG